MDRQERERDAYPQGVVVALGFSFSRDLDRNWSPNHGGKRARNKSVT